MQLKDYIKGNRRGKEANRLERQAMNDKFLQEALDGFDAVACDHIQVIERLEKKIAATAATPQNKRNIFFYVSIAASILLLIGFGVYFLPERNETKNAMVMLQADEREMDYAATPSSPVLSEQSEEAPESKMNERQRTVSAEKRVLEELREQTEELREQPVNIVPAEDIIEEEMSQVSTLVAAKQIAAKSSEILPVEEQEKAVFSGKVVDESGDPLVGVSIIISGTTIGTSTDVNGHFTIHFPENDSSKLIASYVGYEAREIKFSDSNIIALTPDNQSVDEVVIVAFGTQKKAVSEINKRQRGVDTERFATESDNITFGKKEFQAYCRQKAGKNVCDGKKVTVKVSFFIDETGKPTDIKYNGYTCEEAKKEIESLLSSSPRWTTVNKKVTMTVKW